MLKLISLDTNVIVRCVENNISAAEFNELLEGNGFSPVIGLYAAYELGRTFSGDCRDKAQEIFRFIQNLEPFFCCRRDDLFSMECRKIQLGTGVSVFDKPILMEHLKKRIQDYSNGIFDISHENFIAERQKEIKQQRDHVFIPNGSKQKVKELYNNDFSKLISQYLISLKSHEETIQNLLRIIYLCVLPNVKINENDIIHLANNINEYPALRSLIYSNLYLQFLGEVHEKTSSEDIPVAFEI